MLALNIVFNYFFTGAGMSRALGEADRTNILGLFKYAAKEGAGHVKLYWDSNWGGIKVGKGAEHTPPEFSNALVSLYSFQEQVLGLSDFHPSPAVPFSLAALGVEGGGDVSIGRTEVFNRYRVMEFCLTDGQRNALLEAHP